MARAQYKGNAIKLNGVAVEIVPSTSVTLYEAGTATLISGASVFAGPTGVTTLGNPFTTDANGNIVFYLAQARRVKIVAVGVNYGPLVADYEPVLHDPADLIASGQTAFVTLAGGLSVSSADPAAPVLEARSDTALVAAGLRIGGTQGATDAIRVLAKDGSTVLFNVAQGASETGQVTAGTIVPRTSARDLGASGNRWQVGYMDILSLGSGPASTGAIRMSHGTTFYVRNNAGTGDTQLISTAAGNNNITFGDGSNGGITTVVGTTDVRLQAGANTEVQTWANGLILGRATGNHGFFGGIGTSKGTITGSRGSNAALASLLTFLASLNLLTDSSTA